MSDDIVARLTGGSPRHLLDDLSRISAALAKVDRPRPEIELYVSNGQVIRGGIVGVGDDRGDAIAIVQVGGTAKQPTVTFVRVNQIVAVTVVDASLLVKAPTVDAPIPSKLELQRQIAARSDGFASLLGRPLALELAASDLDDDGRRAIGVALPLVVDVITAIANDALGKDALAAIDAIELAAGASADIQLANKRLAIRAPKLVTEQLTHAVLRRAIEKLL